MTVVQRQNLGRPARSRLQVDAVLRIVTKDWERDIGLRRWHGIDAVSIDTSHKEIALKIQTWLKSSHGLIVVAVISMVLPKWTELMDGLAAAIDRIDTGKSTLCHAAYMDPRARSYQEWQILKKVRKGW